MLRFVLLLELTWSDTLTTLAMTIIPFLSTLLLHISGSAYNNALNSLAFAGRYLLLLVTLKSVARVTFFLGILAPCLFNSYELNFDVDHFLAALTTAGNTVCFFCHNSSHTAQACPLLLRTKSDPFAWRIVLRLLGDVSTSTSRSSTQPHRHPGHPSTGPRIHAITTDDDAALFLSPAPNSSPDSDQALPSDPLPMLDPPDVASDNDPDFYLAC